jgi:ribosome-interacting GTPase 1
LGILKAKLAKLRRELITPKSSGGPAGEGFDVAKTGDARIGFVGFPSVSLELRFVIYFVTRV